MPPPPPSNVQPASAWIGTIEDTSISRSSTTGVITATFTIPLNETYGVKDVEVAFTTPQSMSFTKTDAFTVTSGTSADKVYVDADSTAPSPDGLSWATAYSSLADGLQAAAGYGASQIWVADGTYKPTTGTDRTISFELMSGVAVYGGYSGSGTTRDPNTYETILSGDIGSIDVNTDNSYHVVIGADTGTLDGCTITAGYADGEKWYRLGGGMYNGGVANSSAVEAISPVVNNCIFTGNYAESGGGMYNFAATTQITSCIFTQNSANYGGGALFRVGSDATVTNCLFSGNSAQWRGGAVYVDYGADPVISGSEFAQNTTQGIGGGFYADDRASQLSGTYPQLSTCVFTGNQALYRGGAIGIYNSSCEVTVTGCTFSGNTATNAGGNDIACNSSATLKYNGTPDIDADSSCTVTLIQ